MITRESIDKLLAGKATVVGPDGEKIGTVGQIYVDDETGDPNWVTANTGLFGLKETFIPLDAAEATDDEIRVPYTKDQVKDAPNPDPNGHINEEEQDSLYEYYSRNRGAGSNHSSSRDTTSNRDAGRGLLDDRAPAGTAPDAQIPNEGTTRQDAALRDAGGQDATQAAAAQAAAAQAAAPQGTTAQDRDEGGSLTRSEEQVNVGTERHESGRVRLRKYVVTENVTQTVPVSHEEVRVEREPVTSADRDATAGLGDDVGDDEQEVTLHEETPVIDKQAVPVEKVRLEKDTVRDEETVDTEVRKEQIDTERDDTRRD